jgi:diguanylate cyclase (GGDEF)-like protein/PAS domain S-box-containing protein
VPIYLDANSVVISANHNAEQLLGVPRNILIGRKLLDCSPAVINEDGVLLASHQHPVMIALHSGKSLKDVVLGLFNTEKQKYIWLTISLFPESRLGESKPYRLLMTLKDVTSQKMAEVRFSMASIIVNNINEGIFVTDKEGRIISINDAFTRLTGFTYEDVFGQCNSILIADINNKKSAKLNADIESSVNWQGEIWRHHKFDGGFPSWTTINVVRDTNGQITNYIHVFMDITCLNKTNNYLSFLAYHDPLTKLPNRLLVTDRVTHALQNSAREGSKIAVLFLDLDGFKNINDIYGHDAGDLLLKAVAKRITNLVRKEDTVSRYGGDEFIVVMEKIPDIKNPATLAQKLIDSFKKTININGNKLSISTSIGISLYPSDGSDTGTLIKNADTAMYLAKHKGRNNFKYYNASLNTEKVDPVLSEDA